jgi:hypothetical protein
MQPLLWVAALFLASLCPPLSATAEDNPWVPAISGWGGVFYQSSDVDGTSSSPDRADLHGNASMLYSGLALSTELMTPKLLEVPGAPALFMHGGVQFAFSPGWNVDKEGSAGKIEVPLTPIGGFPPPGGVSGTGTTAREEAKVYNYAAGIGVAFEFPLAGRMLRIRPSFEYRHDEIDYRLRFVDAQALVGTVCPCGIARVSIREQRAFHSIGPGIELEMDAMRAGPIMLTLFASGRFYHLLGEDETRLAESNGVYSPPVPGFEPVAVESTFQRDPWTIQAGVGIRFRWLPDDSL